MARASFLSPILGDRARPHSLQIVRNSRTLARRIELAVDSSTRRRGLLGRDTFERGSALIIAPCGAIHTFFMRFAIDIVFVTRDGRVLKTYGGVPRRRIAFSLRAFAAIELPAGAVADSDVTPGDVVRLVDA